MGREEGGVEVDLVHLPDFLIVVVVFDAAACPTPGRHQNGIEPHSQSFDLVDGQFVVEMGSLFLEGDIVLSLRVGPEVNIEDFVFAEDGDNFRAELSGPSNAEDILHNYY